MKRKAVLTGVLVFLLMTVGVIVCQETTGLVYGQGEAATRLPQVTPDEKARAIDIVLSDARIRELLSGKGYKVAPDGRIGLWHAEPEAGSRKLGVAMDIDFDREYFVEYDWTDVRWKDGKMTSLETTTIHRTLVVRGLFVCVDLNADKVAVILPR